MVIFIRQAATIAPDDLDQLGPVLKPLSSPPSRLIGRRYLNDSPGVDSMGIWECSPGHWRRTVMQEEFAHFITGSARFTPDDGEPIDVRAGDTIWFPANSNGVWDIIEHVRKVYVIIDRPSFAKRCKARAKAILAAWGFAKPAPSDGPYQSKPTTADGSLPVQTQDAAACVR